LPEANGTGRLDRIEAALETAGHRINELTERFNAMVDHHDHEFKQLLTWQVLMQEKMDRCDRNWEREQEEAARERNRLDALNGITDKRIADLVSAIGKLVQDRSQRP
jgi:hypothetical protein